VYQNGKIKNDPLMKNTPRNRWPTLKKDENEVASRHRYLAA
jgi:hypothetical protein